jgi:DNA-binding NarL/FixJ family response regulator
MIPNAPGRHATNSGSPATKHQNARPAIVVLADEPTTLRTLYNGILSQTDAYDVIAVASGPELLAQIAQQPIALAIIDDRASWVNSLELARQIARLAPATRLALITASASGLRSRRARSAGVTYLFVRQVLSEDLTKVVQSTLLPTSSPSS